MHKKVAANLTLNGIKVIVVFIGFSIDMIIIQITWIDKCLIGWLGDRDNSSPIFELFLNNFGEALKAPPKFQI